MTFFERLIALLIIVVLLIFAIAQQVEIAKLGKLAEETNNNVTEVVNTLANPLEQPESVVKEHIVYKIVYKYIKPKRVIRKRHKRLAKYIRIKQTVAVKVNNLVNIQADIITAQQNLIDVQKRVAESDKRVSELKIKTLEFKNVSLELELKAIRTRCNYEAEYRNHNKFNNNRYVHNISNIQHVVFEQQNK